MTLQELQSRLNAYALRARSLVELCGNEEQTKVSLINPYIELLGYDVRDPRQVRLEHRADFHAGTERVDYAVMRDGAPWLLVEAKPATASLGAELPTKQIQRYVMASDVQYVVLTNGRSWCWFRKSSGEQRLEETPFLVHDVLEPSNAELRWLLAVHASHLDLARIASAADEERLRQDFRAQIDVLLTDPPEPFLRFLLNACGYRATSTMLDRAGPAWLAVVTARDAAQLEDASRRFRGESVATPSPVSTREAAQTEPNLPNDDGSKEASNTQLGANNGMDNDSDEQVPSRRRWRFRYRFDPTTPWLSGNSGRSVQVDVANELLRVLQPHPAQLEAAIEALNVSSPGDKLRSETVVAVDPGAPAPRYFAPLYNGPFAVYVNLSARQQAAWFSRAMRDLPILQVETDAGIISDEPEWISVSDLSLQET